MKTHRIRLSSVVLLGGLTLAACDNYGDDDNDYGTGPEPVTPHSLVTGTGDISAKVNEFRALLGDPLNGGTRGQQAGGWREVNWDGVPAARTNTNDFPGDFFNTNAVRGVIFSTPGTGFRVSDNDFGDVDTRFSTGFNAFSPAKTFMSVGSNVTDNRFVVAGDTIRALVAGFGVVFSDVDRAGTTLVEFYDLAGKLLAREAAPVRSDANGLSFVGVKFATAIVARVRIISGQAGLRSGDRDISDGGTLDLVVMDDFLFSEPVKQ